MSISNTNQARGKSTPASSGGSFKAENRSDPEGQLPTQEATDTAADLASHVADGLNADSNDAEFSALYRAGEVFGAVQNDDDEWVVDPAAATIVNAELAQEIADALNSDSGDAESDALASVANELGLTQDDDGVWSAPTSVVTIDESVFDNEYKPRMKPSEDYFELEDLEGLDPKTVWTIVEGDYTECEPGACHVNADGNDCPGHSPLFAQAGVRNVNTIGFITTEKPWERGDELAEW